MTRPWWVGSMGYSLLSLLGCARAREHYADLGFEDRAAEALVAQVGLRNRLFSDEELRRTTLVTMMVDALLEQQLTVRPGATVVHLGSGLSTRRERFGDWRGGWVEVDEPAVAEMKRELLGRRQGLTCELGDTSWVDAVSAIRTPLVLVSESGMLEAAAGDFHAVLDAITSRLPTGTELIFALDRRHPALPAAAGSALAFTRTGPDHEPCLVRYPRLRTVDPATHDPDVARALACVDHLAALHAHRVPSVRHVRLT